MLAHPGSHAESLIQDILARTTGSTCETAQDRLGDFTDGALEAPGLRLVARHLAHCSACAELALVLARTAEGLPLLAEVHAPAALAESIFKATTRRPVPLSLAWWHRPRLALETAYLAAAAGFVVISLPMPKPAQTIIHKLENRAQELRSPRPTRLPAVRVQLPSARPKLRLISARGSKFLRQGQEQARSWWTRGRLEIHSLLHQRSPS